MNYTELIAQVNNALPQTQCTQCGHKGCEPYASAIVLNDEPINQCPPGGHAGIIQLAHITGQPVTLLNPSNGIELPLAVAHIVEAACIGCTKCIQACPVDAIVGSTKLMHSVLSDICTGCGLCVPPCPVDCIDMLPAQQTDWQASDAQAARQRFESRNQRLLREAAELNQKRIDRNQKSLEQTTENPSSDESNKQAIVQAALARARLRRNNTQSNN